MKLVSGIYLRISALTCSFLIVTSVPSFAEDPSAIRVLLAPANFRMHQIDAAGSSELEPDWTRVSKANLDTALYAALETREDFVPLPFPELSEKEVEVVEEHIALYETAAVSAIQMIDFAGIKDKKKNFNYTIGPGLAFLAEKTGADAVIFLVGEQQKSTGGRVAMMVLAAAAGAATSTGGSLIIAGIVDLRTGDIRWINYMAPITGGDARDAEQTPPLIDKLVNPYPSGRLLGGR